MKMPLKKKDFSIDDAFSETAEDRIRLYPKTSETVPLTETILEEPPGYSEASPGENTVFVTSPDTTKGPKPIIKNTILKNPSLKALKTAEDSTSQDSTSLIPPTNPGYYSGQLQSQYWWQHPKVRQNWKVVVASMVLVLLGSGLILTGIVAYSHPSLAGIQGFVFFLAGFICLLPGAYHIIYAYLAVKGKRGFDFHHLPLFN